MRRRDTSLSAALDEFVEFIDADRHKKNIRTMFTHAGPFLEDRGVERVEEIEVLDCREFAKYLSRLVDEDEIAASTANTYYSQFRSWLGFCVRDEMLDVNPAEKRRAEEMLPEEKGEDDQQFWSREEREAILEAADDQAESSMDQLTEPGWAPAFRNRAILYTLCYTGGRIGEIIGRGDDSERNGLTWSDVDLAGQSVRVFGKNREYEHMQLPSPAGAVLAEYREIVSPPTDDWPVFPSNSASKLYQVARAQLADRGLEEQEREALLEGREIYDVFSRGGARPTGHDRRRVQDIVLVRLRRGVRPLHRRRVSTIPRCPTRSR